MCIPAQAGEGSAFLLPSDLSSTTPTVPPQAPDPGDPQHEDGDALLVSALGDRAGWDLFGESEGWGDKIHCPVGAREWQSPPNSCLPTLGVLGEALADPAASPRFDLMGLTPDAPEDEAGIKKAAENSKELCEGGGELLCASPSL